MTKNSQIKPRQFRFSDYMGNVYTMWLKGNGTVVFASENGVPNSPSNFVRLGDYGYEEAEQRVQEWAQTLVSMTDEEVNHEIVRFLDNAKKSV